MTSKEKVLNAMNHIEGKVPLDFGGTGQTGIHCSVVENLREYYGLEKKPVYVFDTYQFLGYIDEDLRQSMGCDVVPILGQYDFFGMENTGKYTEWETPWGQKVIVNESFAVTEENGKTYFHPGGNLKAKPTGVIPEGGMFADALPREQAEIDDDDLNPEDNLEEFNLLTQENIDYLRKQYEKIKDSDYAISIEGPGTAVGDISWVPAVQLENPKGIRDITEWYMSTITRQDYLAEVFDRQTDIALENIKTYYEIFGDSIDIIKICGHDFGTQSSLFYSVDTFRELFKPYYKKMNDWIHANTNWKTFKHSDGSIEPLIEELFEAGFDLINPIQWTADNMDPQLLKEKYGDKVTFWGGGVNTQHTLPFGTPEEVREEVLRMMEILAKGGGFVISTIHNLQAKTPTENVIAMIDAIHEFNGSR